MNPGECFKINSIGELKKAYDMFEDKWLYYFKNLIKDFNKGDRYVLYDTFGLCLVNDILASKYIEIQSPLINVNNLNKLI